MPRYLVLWKANPSAWPSDAKGVLGVLEGAIAGGDYLVAGGAVAEIGWFTDQEGYAIFDVSSKESVLGMIQPFFPFYSPDVREIVPWDAGKKAVLDSARQAASR